jgi:hypothetical protein
MPDNTITQVLGRLPLWLGFFGTLLAAYRLSKRRLGNLWIGLTRSIPAIKMVNDWLVSTTVWLRVRGVLPVWDEEEEARNIKRQLEKQIPRRDDQHRGFSYGWSILILAILVVSWGGWMWLAITDHREISDLRGELAKYRSDTVTEHHVLFSAQLDDGDFSFTSDEEPQGGAFRPCPADIANHLDVPGILAEAIGYNADVAIWEERGTCKSILRADLGVWFKDKNTNFKYARGRNVRTTE